MGEKTSALRSLLARLMVESAALDECLKASARDVSVFAPRSAASLLAAGLALAQTRNNLLALMVSEIERLQK